MANRKCRRCNRDAVDATYCELHRRLNNEASLRCIRKKRNSTGRVGGKNQKTAAKWALIDAIEKWLEHGVIIG